MSDASVLSRVDGSVATLTLNRPKAINALDHEMVLAMEKLLARWADDPAITAVIVEGAGERGLCAGGDIVAIHRDAAGLVAADHEPGAEADAAAAATPSALFWRDEYRLNAAIARYPKPYIAIMDGIVMGGGVGISAHANTRIVTDRTKIGMPEVGIGFIPDVGGTYLLSHIADCLGTYAALTAGTMRGGDAIALGLADHFVASENLDAFLDLVRSDGLDDALSKYGTEPPASSLAAQRDWIGRAFAADSVMDILQNLRTLDTLEAGKAADTIAAKSPMTTAVALRALQQAVTAASLPDALAVEYRIALRCMLYPDMAEGIRAQVIDKDRTPRWHRATVTAAEVDAFFAPLPDGLELPIHDWPA